MPDNNPSEPHLQSTHNDVDPKTGEKPQLATQSSRYQLLQILLPPLVMLAVGIGGTAWFGDWFKARFSSSLTSSPTNSMNPTTTIEREIIYAKILFFRDR